VHLPSAVRKQRPAEIGVGGAEGGRLERGPVVAAERHADMAVAVRLDIGELV